MVYRIFLDTDIILDYLLERAPYFKEAEQIFLLTAEGSIYPVTSSSILINVMYFLRKGLGRGFIKAVDELLTVMDIINPGKNTIQSAINSHFADKEDAVQYYTALQQPELDYFITRNMKDYKHQSSQLPVISPQQLLKLVQ